MTQTPLCFLRFDELAKTGFYPRTILDIGAHNGGWSILTYNFFPQSKIFLVEANTDNQINPQEIPGIIGYEYSLLGEKKKKKVRFYLSNDESCSTGNSVYCEKTKFFSKDKYRLLPMTTLDDLVKKNNLKNIDFIKIDTQGSELSILRGGKNTIKKAHFILLELQVVNYNNKAPFFEDVVAQMSSWGFHIYDVFDFIYNKKSAKLLQIEILFVNKNSRFDSRYEKLIY